MSVGRTKQAKNIRPVKNLETIGADIFTASVLQTQRLTLRVKMNLNICCDHTQHNLGNQYVYVIINLNFLVDMHWSFNFNKVRLKRMWIDRTRIWTEIFWFRIKNFTVKFCDFKVWCNLLGAELNFDLQFLDCKEFTFLFQ